MEKECFVKYVQYISPFKNKSWKILTIFDAKMKAVFPECILFFTIAYHAGVLWRSDSAVAQ